MSFPNLARWGVMALCYDFVITQVVIRQSFDSTFIFGLRYKVYSGKAKLQLLNVTNYFIYQSLISIIVIYKR